MYSHFRIGRANTNPATLTFEGKKEPFSVNKWVSRAKWSTMKFLKVKKCFPSLYSKRQQNAPIRRPMKIPNGAKVQTSPSLATDSAVPFTNPPPTVVAGRKLQQKIATVLYLGSVLFCGYCEQRGTEGKNRTEQKRGEGKRKKKTQNSLEYLCLGLVSLWRSYQELESCGKLE